MKKPWGDKKILSLRPIQFLRSISAETAVRTEDSRDLPRMADDEDDVPRESLAEGDGRCEH